MRPESANPKAALGRAKISPHLVPPVAILEESVAYSLGGGCYGSYNWQEPGQAVDVATYRSAAVRHLMAWFMGETCHAEGQHHLGAARACLGVLLDAEASGNLIDSRPRTTSTSAHMPVLQERLAPVQEAIAARKAQAAAAPAPAVDRGGRAP